VVLGDMFMNIRLFKECIRALPKNAKVLDAGCGSGNVPRFLKQMRKDVTIYGIDLEKKVKKDTPDFVNFFVGSVESMKMFKDSFFDCILCFHVLEHLENPGKAIKEFQRVLKRKGRLFIESPHWISTIMPIGYNFYDDVTHKRPYTKKTLLMLLHDSQLDIKKIGFDTPIFFYLADLYKINKRSIGYFARKIIYLLNMYKTAVWVYAVKKE